MEPVAAAVDAVYAVAEKYLMARLQKTPFGLALVTETAGIILPNLDKFREEQKTEVIVAVLNLLYKSERVVASLKSLDETTRSKIDNFMTNALPDYVAVMNTSVAARCLPSFSLFNCFTVSATVPVAPDALPVAAASAAAASASAASASVASASVASASVAAPSVPAAAVAVPVPAAESLVVRQPEPSPPAASLQSDPRQPEETYEKGSTPA
jgi:hypothetical protein